MRQLMANRAAARTIATTAVVRAAEAEAKEAEEAAAAAATPSKCYILCLPWFCCCA